MVGEARGWWGGKEEAGERGEEEERGGRGEQRKVAAGKGQTTWQSSTSSARYLLDLLRTHLISVASCAAPLLTGSEGRTDRTISVLSFSNVPYHSFIKAYQGGQTHSASPWRENSKVATKIPTPGLHTLYFKMIS